MDGHTLYLTYLGTVLFFAMGLGLLASSQRRSRALLYFCASEFFSAGRLLLRGLEDTLPTFYSRFLADVLLILMFLFVYLGLASFLQRAVRLKPILWMLAAWLAAYGLFYARLRDYSVPVAVVPILIFCAASISMLLSSRIPEFREVARVTATLLSSVVVVVLVRTAQFTRYDHGVPYAVVRRYAQFSVGSTALLMFLEACLVACYIWFFVASIYGELNRLVRTDWLTGALSRRALETEAQREVERSIRSGANLAMILFDVDHFKTLNDDYGHSAGDAALRGMVRRVQSQLRTFDLLARSGGDEFTALLPGTDLAGAREVAERVRRAIETLAVPVEGTTLRCTASCGVSQLGREENNFEALLRRADRALYDAKRMGRNRVVVQNSEADREGSHPNRS